MDARPTTWTDIATHPEGFVLSICETSRLKKPWVSIRLTRLEWADRRKKDRYVWLEWNASSKQLKPCSNSPTTVEFASYFHDIQTWVRERMGSLWDSGALWMV